MSDLSELRAINEKLTNYGKAQEDFQKAISDHGKILEKLLTSFNYIEGSIRKHESLTMEKFKTIEARLDNGNTRFRGIELELSEIKADNKFTKATAKLKKDNEDMLKRPIYGSIIVGIGALVVFILSKFFKDGG